KVESLSFLQAAVAAGWAVGHSKSIRGGKRSGTAACGRNGCLSPHRSRRSAGSRRRRTECSPLCLCRGCAISFRIGSATMMNDTGFFGDQQGGDLSRLFAECNDRIRMAGGELPALSDLRDILGPSAVMGQGHSDEDLALLIE